MEPDSALFSRQKGTGVWGKIPVFLVLLCYCWNTILTQAQGVDVLKQLRFSGTRTGQSSSGRWLDGVIPFRCGLMLTSWARVQVPVSTIVPAPFTGNNLSLVFTFSVQRINTAFLFAFLSKKRKLQLGVQLSPGVVSVHVGQNDAVRFDYNVHDGRWHHMAVHIEGSRVSLLTPYGRKNMFLNLDSKLMELMDPGGFFSLGRMNHTSPSFEGAICQFDIYPTDKALQNYCDYLNKATLLSSHLNIYTTQRTPFMTEPFRNHTSGFRTQRSWTSPVSTENTDMLNTTMTHEDLSTHEPDTVADSSLDPLGLTNMCKYQMSHKTLQDIDYSWKETEEHPPFKLPISSVPLKDREASVGAGVAGEKVLHQKKLQCLTSLNSFVGQDAKVTPTVLTTLSAGDDFQTFDMEHMELSLQGPPGLRGDPDLRGFKGFQGYQESQEKEDQLVLLVHMEDPAPLALLDQRDRAEFQDCPLA